MSERQISNIKRLIQETQARIQQRQAKDRPTKNLEKDLADYQTDLKFYEADTPEKIKALKDIPGVAYTEVDPATGKVIATTMKPETVTKAETPRVSVKAEKIQDLHADLDKLKSDADKLQSQIGVTKKQQTELKQTIKEIEATRDKLRGKRQELKDIRETAEKIEKIRDDLTEKKGMYRVGGTAPKFKETMEALQTSSDEFFSKSGLPDAAEINKYLQEHPGARLGPSKWKAKNTDEALNRLGYAAAQMSIGGAVEVGLPFSLTAVPPLSREADRGFRVLGGLLTPSPADLLAGQLLSKIAKSKTWRKIIGKYGEVEVTELEKAAAREIEKLKGPGQPYSTAEIRKGVNKIYRKLEDVAEFYKDHPELATPERSSAGSAQVPKVVLEFEDFLDDLGWDMDEYLNFMRSRAPELPAGTIVNILAGSMDRGTTLEDTVIDLGDYKDLPMRLIDREKLKTEPDTGTGEATEEDTTEETTGGGGTGEREDQVTEQVVEEVVDGGQETIPEPPPPEEPAPPGEPTPIEEPTLPFLPESKPEERRDIRLRLWGGPKEKYKVKFTFPGGPSQTLTVEARSFPEAVNRAQRSRRGNRYLPSVVDIERVK